MSEMNVSDCDVIIIGAGISGLSAAYHFKKKFGNVSFKVLEARPRIGGRLLAAELTGPSNRKFQFDIGGQFIGQLHSDLLTMLKELDMSHLLYSQFVTGKKVCWLEPNSIVKYTSELPFLSPLIQLEAYNFLKKMDNYADQLDADNPFLRNPSLADYLDSMSVEGLIRQHLYVPELRELLRIAIRTTFGFEANQMSALYAILSAKSSGHMEALFSATEDGAQKFKLEGGMFQLSARLAKFIGMENIVLDSPVIGINQTGDAVIVETTSRKFRAKKVIAAVPPAHLLKMNMEPALPASRVEVLRVFPMANLSKFLITYERPFWKEKGFSGETVCYGGLVDKDNELDCPVGPVSVTFDYTLPEGCPALIGFTAGHQTVYWSRCSMEERKKVILKNLAKMLGDEALQAIDYKDKNWANEEWTGGCPVACLQPGVGRFFTASVRLPHGRIHMAGTETAQQAIGYISGAVQAGRRAAVEVMYSLDKNAVEDVAILATTCYGPAGRAQKWPIKWPMVNDPCVLIGQPNRFWCKMLVAACLGAVAYHFLAKKGCPESWTKLTDFFSNLKFDPSAIRGKFSRI